jgi:hypothetical protein
MLKNYNLLKELQINPIQRRHFMAQEGIYKTPIFLNSVTHKDLKIAPVTHFKFAVGLNSVVVVGQEFLEAAKLYPVVFTKTKNKETIPVALLGLRNNENLFVDQNGNWKEGAYVPAFFRRYPFILASNVGQDGGFAVCADSGYEGFGKEDGMALFDGEGKQTKEFSNVVQFLTNYQAQHAATVDMIRILTELDLFRDVSANITLPAGEKLGFAGLTMVDETKMAALDDEKVVQLFRKGYLAWIYAHLYSMSNFRSLMKLASKTA